MKGNIKGSTSSARRTGNIVQNIPAKQTTGGLGGSAMQATYTGSGSRPTRSKYPIGSSAPEKAQQIRPSNPADRTPNYGK